MTTEEAIAATADLDRRAKRNSRLSAYGDRLEDEVRAYLALTSLKSRKGAEIQAMVIVEGLAKLMEMDQ